jgi:NADPH:quinone reductase-like Zn-dependent oxidoreductase
MPVHTKTGERYDLIVDCQSNRAIADYKRTLAVDGTYALIGGSKIIPILIQQYLAPFTGEGRKFCLVAEGPNKGLSELKTLIETNELTPIIDKVYPLEEAQEAFRYFGEGLHKGKIVITI